MEALKTKIAFFLFRAGVSADFLTVAGLALAFTAGWFIWSGLFFWAGVFVLFSGVLDLLDGAVARASEVAHPFGGILDSSLDRYGDGFIFGGAALFYAGAGKLLYAALALGALLGAFSISYIRARAECEMETCRVGFWERGERLVYAALGLALNNFTAALWILGIATHVTAVQRLLFAFQKGHVNPLLAPEQRRGEPAYFFKIGILIWVILFWRPV
ncbi:MAG: CDP-alcohol phosphatidyltransferase family protein [Candidatus Omnitrophica bacterium]|nr:CDP-alcohol phosphatidyltransferase family protein [Candidatus Omnitrophota bacterium]